LMNFASYPDLSLPNPVLGSPLSSIHFEVIGTIEVL